jgi:hypothetical protein
MVVDVFVRFLMVKRESFRITENDLFREICNKKIEL